MNVNKDIFENKWEQIRAQSKIWWSLFTDEDLKKVEKAPIKLDKYAMMLRMKYGHTHERAREEIRKRIAELDEIKQLKNLGTRRKTLKLQLLFIVMDVLTVLAFPIVFMHGKLRQFSKPEENIRSVNSLLIRPITASS